MTNQINLELLSGLSEEERKVALQILKEYADTGKSELFEGLKYADFDELPVDIKTFLHDPVYLGRALTDPDGRFTLYPYWEKCLEDIFPDNLTTKYNNIVFTGAIGLGKAQPLDALVLTKNGFKKMGELTLEDHVFGNDGHLHKLVGIFPQGTKKMCKVTFTDNTSTICCEDHLWTVYNTKSQVWTTISVKQLLNGSRNLNHAAGHRYKIPITRPINFEEKEVVIDPYMLGVLLGDGHITDNVTFSSNDQEIVNNVASCLDEGYEVRKLVAKMTYSVCKVKNNTYYDAQLKTQIPVPNKYMTAIRQYNLDVTTADKYIPQDYLINSVENRIALLQGLMDTDGYVSKDGSLIEFSTISEKLKDNFVFLVQSLGGTCRIRTKVPSYRDKNGNKKYGKLCYNIGIKLPKSINPFRLSRKKNKLSEKALEPYRYIKSIEYVEDQECQCIYIDSQEHLYLTNDFIVTHNSTIAIIAILYMLHRLLCLKDPYQYYGMQPIDKLSISLMNITLENAKGVALDKMNQMILSSDWFLQHGEMAGTSNLIFRPEKHIEIVLASSNNQIIGRAIFANFTDKLI